MVGHLHGNVAIHGGGNCSKEKDCVEESPEHAKVGEGSQQRVIRYCLGRVYYRPVRWNLRLWLGGREGGAQLNEQGDGICREQLAEEEEEKAGADGPGCQMQDSAQPPQHHGEG